MSRRILSLALSGFLIIVLFSWSCTKLDTTNIGSDLLPAVDNINTFADTLDINTTQGVFDDTTKLSVSNSAENYVFGKNDDPVLGKTDATLFLQLKPDFYPYYLGAAGDTLVSLDSVVLCLAFKGVYGDTTTPMYLDVHAVKSTQHDEWDSLGTYSNPSLRNIKYAPDVDPVSIANAPALVYLPALRSYQKIGKGTDSVIGQIRIKLNSTFGNMLFEQDSVLNGANFSRDTLFRSRVNNGFAVSMSSGNGLLYTQLSDENTRLEIHFKCKRALTGTLDTVMSQFVYNNGANGTSAPRRGAVADHIVRTRNPLPSPGDQELYLQTAPGTYANLNIPGLTGYSNRIVHRAEIIVEQIPSNPISDGYFYEPPYLYLDLIDSATANKWKPIYYDLNPSYSYDPDHPSNSTSVFDYFPITQQVDYSYFGGTPHTKIDATAPSGTRKYYTINITRHVQRICTKQTRNYDMRLFAPFNIIYPQYTSTVIPYSNNIAAGRVRVGGGNATDPKYKMRLRVIYSKLN